MKAVVAERGQVTIPKQIRDRLGITPGTLLDFTEDNGTLMAKKVIEEDRFARVRGCLNLDRPTDEILREMRGEL